MVAGAVGGFRAGGQVPDGGPDPPVVRGVAGAGVGGGRGGVLGQVAGDLLGTQGLVGVVGAAAGLDGAGVELAAEGEHPARVVPVWSSTPGVVSRTDVAAWRIRAASVLASMPAGAGAKPSRVRGPSRRTRAWKWTTPRSWYSATLVYCTVAASPSRDRGMPSRVARSRRSAMVNRRHRSGADHCQSTWEG